MSNPELKYLSANGARLAYFEWGAANPNQPTLFFVHATGFHGRLWDQIIKAMPNVHAIAFEQRGHGRSESLPARHWEVFGQDQTAVVSALGLKNMIGIGHSMGAHGLLDAAAASGAFARLLLLDPTVKDPAAYADAPAIDFTNLHGAARRRARFASVDAMVESLQTKGSFHLFEPQILRDYCQHGLALTDDGDYALLCEPAVEAHVYMTSLTNARVFDSIAKLDIPVDIVRAQLPQDAGGDYFSASPTWPGLVCAFANATDLHLPDCTHFIPMQRPQLGVDLVTHAMRDG